MKQFFVILLLLLGELTVSAQVISETEAKLVAVNWMNSIDASRNYSVGNIGHVFAHISDNCPVYYIVTFKSSGWVFVSGSDKAEPVLGYSSESKFDPENSPVQLQEWFSGREKEIEASFSDDYASSTEVDTKWKYLKSSGLKAESLKTSSNQVGPLLSCAWNQGRYFNELAPEDTVSTANNGHVWIGCVATAMAQLMKYWEFPSSGLGENSYEHSDYGTLSVGFASSVYDWESMSDTVLAENTEVQKISYHAAVAVNTDFSPYASSAYPEDACNAFINYFKFNSSIFLTSRKRWNDDEWIALLKSELDRGRPLIYSGENSQKTGHTFICDGYTNNYFHFNWGWGGYANGNYLLSALTPGNSDYTNNQTAICNLEPVLAKSIETPYTEGFENRNEIAFSLLSVAEVSGTESHSGDKSICLSESELYSYSRNVASLSFTAPAQSRLRFWVKRYTPDISAYNTQKALLMTEYGETILATIFEGDFNDDNWINYDVDLSAYNGQTVRLMFIQENQDVDDAQWMYIDDVSITKSGQNLPPFIPANPSPADSLTNVELTPEFSWSGGDPNGDEVSYYVCLGNDSLLSVIDTVTKNEYACSELQHSTTFYWKIIADDGVYQSESPVWSFTTKGIPPTMEIYGFDSITKTSAKVYVRMVNNNGASPSGYGICWSRYGSPTVDSSFVNAPELSDSFQCTISGLDPYTVYYVKAFVLSDKGTGYSKECTFRTSPDLANLSVNGVQLLSRTTAVVSGTVEQLNDSAIIKRGALWALEASFDSTDARLTEESGNWTQPSDFEVQVENIPGPDTVFFRLFATNSAGTSYSEEKMFITKNKAPTIDLDADNSSGDTLNNFIGQVVEQEHGGAIADSDFYINDADSDTIKTIELILTNQVVDEEEYLSVYNADKQGITIEGNNSDTLLLLNSGELTTADFIEILKNVECWIDTDNPDSSVIREVKVKATDGIDFSEPATAYLSVQPVNDPPVAETAPSIEKTPVYGQMVRAVKGSWIDSLDNCTGNFLYEYQWQVKSNGIVSDIPGAVTDSLQINDSLCGCEIRVVETVIDRNCGGENEATASSSSDWAAVEKAGQTIVFDSIPVRSFQLEPYILTGSSSSGLPLTYSASTDTIVKIVNDSVFMKKTGSVIISAVQEGNQCYIPSEEISNVLTIEKGIQEIRFEAFDTLKYSDSLKVLKAAATSGLPLTIALSEGAPAFLQNDTLYFTGVGTLEINMSQPGNSNWNAVDTTMTAEILKGEQTIQFDTIPTAVYGQKSVSLTASSTSGLSISFEPEDTTIATANGNQLWIQNAGETSVKALQQGNDLWNPAAPVSQKLLVKKAGQIIKKLVADTLTTSDVLSYESFTTSSGLPVDEIASSDTLVICTNADSVWIVGRGEAVLTVKQSGTNNYKPVSAQYNFVVVSPLKLTRFPATSFDVFPNPASDVINIAVDGEADFPLDLTLLNTLGQVQLETKMSKSFKVIDSEYLKRGVYFIVIESEKHYYIEKLIVK